MDNYESEKDKEKRLRIRRLLAMGGYFPIPIAYREKAPRMLNWQRFVYDPDDPLPLFIRGHPHPATGVRAKGIVAFDLDIEDEAMLDEARGIVERICGATPCVRGRNASAKLALFYRAPDTFETARGAEMRFRLAGQQKLEIYGNGGVQMVVEGEHATSTDARPVHYVWEEDALWDVPRADLPLVEPAMGRAVVEQVIRAMPPPDGAERAIGGHAAPPEACVRNIVRADDFHASTLALIGHLVEMGWQPELVLQYVDWVYSAVDPATLSAQRAQDYAVRRADIARCVRDIARRELHKADSLYARMIGAGAIEDFWMANRRRK